MKRAIVVLVVMLAFTFFPAGGLAAVEKKGIPPSACLQDQYGNQYDFQIDAVHGYIYGIFISAQGCDAPEWPLTGSYVKTGDGYMLELTPANPLGENDTGCVTTFKVKGIYPNAAWYYEDGYGAQEFRWTFCGAPINEDNTQGGILRSSTAFEMSGIPSSACLEDQFGDQWYFQIDAVHKYLYGVVTIAGGCEVPVWPVTGSYIGIADGMMLELTAANPMGAGGYCVTTTKLKGIYPNAAWYYEDGYGGGEFTWIFCPP